MAGGTVKYLGKVSNGRHCSDSGGLSERHKEWDRLSLDEPPRHMTLLTT